MNRLLAVAEVDRMATGQSGYLGRTEQRLIAGQFQRPPGLVIPHRVQHPTRSSQRELGADITAPDPRQSEGTDSEPRARVSLTDESSVLFHIRQSCHLTRQASDTVYYYEVKRLIISIAAPRDQALKRV